MPDLGLTELSILFLIFLIFFIPFWGIPAYIAYRKGRRFWLWYLYGVALWIIALLHALLAQPLPGKLVERQLADGTQVTCPFCAEIIKREAKVCRFCGHEVSSVQAS